MEQINKMFEECFGESPVDVTRLPGAGGNRVYYRVSGKDGKNIIGVEGDTQRDCEAFVELTRIFERHNINVPHIYASSASGNYYLEEDLGDVSLFSLLGKSEDAEKYVADSMRQLAHLQTIPEEEWKDAVKYAPFSKRQVMWDLNYFKYEFLKPVGVDFDEEALEDDFERMANALLEDHGCSGFMFRDFQSRNVMVKAGKVYFIDYQGGRRGPLLYDAVSFLWQAKANFSDAFREKMLDIYIDELKAVRQDVDKLQLMKDLNLFAAFRTLQVLGAYGFRGLVEKRAHFIESIPFAIVNLAKLVDGGVLDEYPELKLAAEALIANPRLKKDNHDGLLIKVFSFSYKKGYPEDLTGNGGGFMFDCRGMHNPGRYDEYKPLTGRDKPVIDFLKERGEVDIFSDKAFELVAPSIECYLRRGFANLQIGFGCTGGRHRSVYCAERVAHLIAEKYPEATIMLIHREHGIVERYNAPKPTAFILAAGLGTRLKPWTLSHPKALVPVGDKPMLQRVIEKLKGQGFEKIVVNVHHFSEQIVDFLKENDFGVEIKISDESEQLLDTGGAVAHAAPLLNAERGGVLVHNVDILSDANLSELMEYHKSSGNDVTLLTNDRHSSRKLAFDNAGELRGWHNLETGATRPEGFTPDENVTEEAFSGIYILSGKAVEAIKKYREQVAGSQVFPIMDFFLSRPEGIRIGHYYHEGLKLIDIGKPNTLAEAQSLF